MWDDPELAQYDLRVAEAEVATELPQPNPALLGYPSYYRFRGEDFTRRHPDLTAPSYYEDEGFRLAERLSSALFQHVSPQGQRWIIRARTFHQLAIENAILNDPADFDALERDPARLRAFGVQIHAQAFLAAGLRDLPAADHVQIATTDGLGELLTWQGLLELAVVAPELAAEHTA